MPWREVLVAGRPQLLWVLPATHNVRVLAGAQKRMKGELVCLYEARRARSGSRIVDMTEKRCSSSGAGGELAQSLCVARRARTVARSATGWRGDLHSEPVGYCDLLERQLVEHPQCKVLTPRHPSLTMMGTVMVSALETEDMFLCWGPLAVAGGRPAEQPRQLCPSSWQCRARSRQCEYV